MNLKTIASSAAIVAGVFVFTVSAQAGVVSSVTQELQVRGIDFATAGSITSLSGTGFNVSGAMCASGGTVRGITNTVNTQQITANRNMVSATTNSATRGGSFFGGATMGIGENSLVLSTPNAFITSHMTSNISTFGFATAVSNGQVTVTLPQSR